MAIPSGSGTEVLKYSYKQALTNSAHTLITGVADHIYTILSIVYTEKGGDTELLRLALYDSDGTSNEHYILRETEIPIYGVFIWNDKFVFSGNKTLRTRTAVSGNVDVICSYIDQDWT